MAAGLTQVELAERAEITDATVSRVERGRLNPSIELAGRLAEALDVSVDQLLRKPLKSEKRPTLRACDRKLLATVRGLTDAEVDDVTRAVRLLLRVGR